jgi:phosphoribosylaminoimidazole carboxylase
MKFSTIGVLGGGQLGRMMASAAHDLGMQIAVLDPDRAAPAGQVANRHVIGDFREPGCIRELADGCDILTVEIEHVNADTLDALAKQGVPVQPAPATLRLIQDKLLQKRHLAEHGIPLAPFADTPDEAALAAAAERFGFPVLLKSRLLAYDGRGNAVVQGYDGLPEAIAALGGLARGLYVEQLVPFERELAVMVARGLDGALAVYPVVETFHRDNILHQVIAPAPIPKATQQTARDIARRAVATFEGAGIFGVELFLLPGGSVLVNEIAPRPHNSGHYTIEACATSQFEQHLRAILGLPLGDTALKVGAAAMINILGVGDGLLDETLRPIERALAIPGAAIHWYGKSSVRAQRKMGHITLTAPTAAELSSRLAELTGDRRPLRHSSGQATTDQRPMTNDQRLPLEGSGDPMVAAIDNAPAGSRFSVLGSDKPLVGIIMGSDSDLPTMKQAAVALRDLGVPFELTIVSAHRTPQRMVDYARSAHTRGLRAIIAGAGGAAHLPGMVAALTPLPVIGVPIPIGPLGGQDALLSIVQMPRGIPVATVAIGNATNAGLLAARIVGAGDPAVLSRVLAYQESLEASVMEKVARLDQVGWENYET